ncbi:Rho GTPase activation protein [Sphaerosporella brunnea]|uniref:Rho GTPase activation protein n=1 Tax=Sphaerosporella brunnea TaxID=1250544 RepID=A0A5J5EQL1_9PEZI|nr:Rho GTPase activation protein [Sphaerosporella brunnea]
MMAQAHKEALPARDPEITGDNSTIITEILRSEIGVATLLTRLKQSISSCKDFAVFLKKRATLEDEHAQGMRKLCRSTRESLRRPDTRQESYARQFEEMLNLHDHLAENETGCALVLHQMHEDLAQLASTMERGRKHWKQFGLSAERKVNDAEQMAEKAKAKYNSCAEECERVRTGDRRGGKPFGFKPSRSGAQYEEELHRRLTAAAFDYEVKVQAAQAQRLELVNSLRPQLVHAVHEMVNECDSGLTAYVQKYSQLNEKLVLSNGIAISPFKGAHVTESRSLRDIVSSIDNDADFKSFWASHSHKMPASPKEPEAQFKQHAGPSGKYTPRPPQQNLPSGPPIVHDESPHNFSLPPIPRDVDQPTFPDMVQSAGAANNQSAALPIQPAAWPASSTSQDNSVQRSSQDSLADIPQLRPVFGVPLDEILARDDCSIPTIVCQCVQAIDLYGLDVEGIYRLSGEKSHVDRIKALFNNDASCINFRRPEDFLHDVHSVASVLKQFLRDLPEPLLTNELYHEFIAASKIDDDISRRDSLHGLINRLPDSNYATLRLLVLHLNRVQEHSNMNRMTSENLAICFGPTLLGSNSNSNMVDAGWQVRGIDTVVQNCFSIFHDE